MSIQTRRMLVMALTAVFFFQTWLVYSDPAGRTTPPLSDEARLGQAAWLRNNCQSCHQVYGFGGFLGPDLTNVARRLVPAAEGEQPTAEELAQRLETVLTTGSARMPAFRMGFEERVALAAFFLELDRTGVGQVKVPQGRSPRELFQDLMGVIAGLEEPQAAQHLEGGRVMAERGCIDCHLPNARSAFRSRDLTRIHDAVARERIEDVLMNGVPEKGMPRFGLTPAEIEAVSAYLELLASHGELVRRSFAEAEAGAELSLGKLPWFEYE